MVPMSLRILAPPTSDTSEAPSLVLQCDARKYMFNVGEGTTRVSAQHRASNMRVDHIFLTRVASETMGGIPGLLMTLADGGRGSIDIHAPPNLLYALAATRLYARRDTMALNAHEIEVREPHVCYQDEYVQIHSVPLVPAQHRSLYTDIAEKGPALDVKAQLSSPKALRGSQAKAWYECILRDAWTNSERTSPGPARSAYLLPPPPVPYAPDGPEPGRQAAVLAYICAGHTQRGKFDAEQAMALGVPPGKSFARLARGETITISRPVAWEQMDQDARQAWLRAQQRRDPGPAPMPVEDVQVASQEVVGASRAGPVFFYLHVPTPAHVEALVQSDAFAPYTHGANQHLAPEQRRTPHVMLHAAPQSVWDDERYRSWRQRFGPDCHHLLANRDVCADQLTYTSNAVSLDRLSELDAQVFAVPGHAEARVQVADALPVWPNMHVSLQPRGEPSQWQSTAPALEARAALPSWDAYCDMAKQVRSKAPVPPRTAAAGLADHLVFTTLGTGSSAPSKYRNVLSTLIEMPGDGYVVLDAGESTYFQLARRFGPGMHGWDGVGVDRILRDLRLLFVSHIHGDHHMGVARLLLERRKLRPTEPLVLVANNYTRVCLAEYDALEDLGLRDMHVFDSASLDWQRGDRTWEAGALARLERVCTAPVSHRMGHCYGIVLQHKHGWKVVFSGDTMPCEALVQAGQGATVLIHEATMQDDEAALAAAKGHSTIGQACQVAQDMHAEHLLLTHFSQRYPKLARIGAVAGVPMGIAFDMMRMTPAQLRRLVAGHGAMALLLDTEHESDDEEAKAPSPKKARRVHTSSTQFAHQYVLVSFTGHGEAPPSELSVSQGVQEALQAAHGVVGGAIHVDVLYAGPPRATTGIGEAVLRVDAAHVGVLTSALSSAHGSALATLTGRQPGLRVRLSNVSHHLGALGTNQSRAWTMQQQNDLSIYTSTV